jgi:hypothetical protein
VPEVCVGIDDDSERGIEKRLRLTQIVVGTQIVHGVVRRKRVKLMELRVVGVEQGDAVAGLGR